MVDLPDKLYFRIGEVAELVGVEAHVLRYWETEFASLRPRKNRAGNRTYRDKDVKLVLGIRNLLYQEGFTIKGARNKLSERRAEIDQIEIPFSTLERQNALGRIRRELESLLLEIA